MKRRLILTVLPGHSRSRNQCSARAQHVVATDIDRNLINIRDLTEHVAHGAKRTAEISQSMASVARELEQAVGQFTI